MRFLATSLSLVLFISSCQKKSSDEVSQKFAGFIVSSPDCSVDSDKDGVIACFDCDDNNSSWGELTGTPRFVDPKAKSREKNDCKNPHEPCSSIKDAIVSAESGDSIILAEAVYMEAGLEVKKPISIFGQGPKKTIIDASTKNDRIFSITGLGGKEVVLCGLTVTGGSAGFGGGIRTEGSKITISNVLVSHNSSLTFGGGIFNSDAPSIITNSIISNNTAADNGSGIYNFSGSPSVMTDTVVINNSSSTNGGGLYVLGDSPIEIRDCTINQNTSSQKGAGIYTLGSETSIINSTVVGNVGAEEGAGIFASSSPLQIIESNVSGNNSGKFGGGIYAHSSILDVQNSEINFNSAVNDGGGIYGTGAPIQILNSNISDNKTNGQGGGICGYGAAPIEVIGSRLLNNAAILGGAISNSADSLAMIQDTAIIGNNAALGGGGTFSSGASAISFLNSAISGNSSNAEGGGIHAEANSSPIINNCSINRNISSENGGGIFVASGLPAVITNSTISENVSTLGGGGIYVEGAAATIVNSTIAHNHTATGGGVASENSLVSFFNTIIAEHPLGADCLKIGRSIFKSDGFNLSSDSSCDLIKDSDQNNARASLSVLLAISPLVEVHLLGEDSDAVKNGAPDCITPMDQRGFVRPLGIARCDIGAIEMAF